MKRSFSRFVPVAALLLAVILTLTACGNASAAGNFTSPTTNNQSQYVDNSNKPVDTESESSMTGEDSPVDTSGSMLEPTSGMSESTAAENPPSQNNADLSVIPYKDGCYDFTDYLYKVVGVENKTVRFGMEYLDENSERFPFSISFPINGYRVEAILYNDFVVSSGCIMIYSADDGIVSTIQCPDAVSKPVKCNNNPVAYEYPETLNLCIRIIDVLQQPGRDSTTHIDPLDGTDIPHD